MSIPNREIPPFNEGILHASRLTELSRQVNELTRMLNEMRRPRTYGAGLRLYAVQLVSAATLGGYYTAYVFNPLSAVAPDPTTSGIAPLNAYGTTYIPGGHPGDARLWYARTITEAGVNTHALLAMRNRLWGIPTGVVTAGGVSIIEIVDGFGIRSCPTGPTAGESMAGVGF